MTQDYKELDIQTINIAITCIHKWRDCVVAHEGGMRESPRFFSDSKIALKKLEKVRSILQALEK